MNFIIFYFMKKKYLFFLILFIFIDWGCKNYTDYYFNGKTNYKLQNYKAAIVNLTKAIELSPYNADAYKLRAYSKQVLGDTIGYNKDLKQYYAIKKAKKSNAQEDN